MYKRNQIISHASLSSVIFMHGCDCRDACRAEINYPVPRMFAICCQPTNHNPYASRGRKTLHVNASSVLLHFISFHFILFSRSKNVPSLRTRVQEGWLALVRCAKQPDWIRILALPGPSFVSFIDTRVGLLLETDELLLTIRLYYHQ